MNYDVNNHYWKRYLKFIKSREQSKGYIENHHIYPRSMFPQKVKDKDNIIPLTAREHFIAHWMLHKAFGGKMSQAFMYMKTGSSERYWNLNSKSYSNLRTSFGRVWSEIKKGKKLPDNHRLAIIAGRLGKPLSESHRQAIADGNRGKVVSEATRKRISAAKIGKPINREMTAEYRAKLSRPKVKSACGVCGKLVSANLINRWHNDNCKSVEGAP